VINCFCCRWRIESWGRVGFDGGDGDTHGDDKTMATMMAVATPTMMTMWTVTWFVVRSWLYRW
jgi:hypothetical protein